MIQDNPELADELEQKIMEALKDADKSPAARARRAQTESSAPAATAPAESKDTAGDLFDDELPDDFSIEEDL